MAASGETNLNSLIRSMQPVLQPGTFVFAQLPATASKDIFSRVQGLNPKMLYREEEAWTIILPQQEARNARLEHIFPCRQITLNIHSSLDAVGFLAAITARLARLEIGVNPVSAFLHDHLFVPEGKENAVMEALQTMAVER